LIVGRAFFFYLRKLVWPSQLVFIYPRWQIDSAAAWQYLYPLAVVIVFLVAIALRRRIGWAPLVALGYYVVTLGPALGFFTLAYHRFSYVQDHFQYLASMGPIALGMAGLSSVVAWLGRRLDWRRPLALYSVAALLLAALTVRSTIQCRPFHDYEALFRHTLARNPTAALAHHNLAVLLARTGRMDEATVHYHEAIRLAPSEPQAYDNLGRLLLSTGRFAEAADALASAARLVPGSAKTRYRLGLALVQSGRRAEAIASWREALTLRPDWVRVERLIAATYADKSELRDGKKAVAYAEAACSHTKENFVACLQVLARAYAADGRLSQAAEAAQRASEIMAAKGAPSLPQRDDEH
jgi:tetratricopeptide (TPR) repeat protein